MNLKCLLIYIMCKALDNEDRKNFWQIYNMIKNTYFYCYLH